MMYMQKLNAEIEIPHKLVAMPTHHRPRRQPHSVAPPLSGTHP